MPELFVITGSNGAGKSSVGPDYLPEYITAQGPVFDSDKLLMQKKAALWQQGLRNRNEIRELANQSVDIEFNTLVDQAIATNSSFAYEGHFSEESSWNTPRLFKQAGYDLHLIFMGLASVDDSEVRVKERALHGGHHVEPLMITNNFYGNLEKLNIHFAWFDTVEIIDTSGINPVELCFLEMGQVIESVEINALPEWFGANLPAIVALME